MYGAIIEYMSPIRAPQFGIKDSASWLESPTHLLLSLQVNLHFTLHAQISSGWL